MADMSGVTACKIRQRVEGRVVQERLTVLVLGISCALALWWIVPSLTIYTLIFAVLLCLVVRPDPRQLAGSEGERLTADVVSALSDEYYVLNQVDLPDPQSKWGVREADLVVAGPHNVVFVLEVKHNGGTIFGQESDSEWLAQKVSRGGSSFERTLRNPIKQVNRQVHLLAGALAMRNKPWVQGVVVFSNPSASLRLRGNTSVPCLRLDELLDYIHGVAPRGQTSHEAMERLYALKAPKEKLGGFLDTAKTRAFARACGLLLSVVASALAAVLCAQQIRPLLPRAAGFAGREDVTDASDAPSAAQPSTPIAPAATQPRPASFEDKAPMDKVGGRRKGQPAKGSSRPSASTTKPAGAESKAGATRERAAKTKPVTPRVAPDEGRTPPSGPSEAEELREWRPGVTP
ncbi:MAG: hypothetical protein RLZZ450_2802 [Pseudomonadota bacterium]|jgi:hypothetical protein